MTERSMASCTAITTTNITVRNKARLNLCFFSKEEDNGQYNCDNSDQVIDLLDLLNVSNDDPLVDRENEEEQL